MAAKPARARRQLNIRVDSALYRAIETLATEERRSVPQAALCLLEAGLEHRTGRSASDDPMAEEVARLAEVGGAFDWLADEPDLYDDTCGEPA